jgi:integrase
MAMIGRSPATIRRRKLTMGRFIAGGSFTLATATHHDIGAWLAAMDVQPQTRGLYLGDLSSFYKWAVKHDYLERDPTVKVDRPAKAKYVPKPIPTNQLKAAIAAAPPRVKVMLTLAGYAGLRSAEIADLRCEDFDHEAGNIRVKGKGQKVRIVPLHPLTAALVVPGSRGPVVGWRGEHVTPASVSDAMRFYLKDVAGLDATGHQARHSFGTRMYAESKDLAAVQETMGHASPNTTRGYVQHSPEVARRAVQNLD